MAGGFANEETRSLLDHGPEEERGPTIPGGGGIAAGVPTPYPGATRDEPGAIPGGIDTIPDDNGPLPGGAEAIPNDADAACCCTSG